MYKKIPSFALIFILVFTFTMFAQVSSRRVSLTVKDTDSKPIEGVKVTITSPERGSFKNEFSTNKKGQSFLILPMQIKTTIVSLEKEGYQKHQESIELIKKKSSEVSFRYDLSFILYRDDELSPEQEAQITIEFQKALPFFNKGMEFFKSERFIEAAVQFEKAVEAKPDFFEAFDNLAASYFRSELFEKSIEAAKKALEINPNSVETIKLIAIAYSNLGDEDTALDYMNELKELPGENLTAEELYNLAVVAANQGNDEEAREYFERSIQVKPDFALAHYQLGLCYFRLNNMQGAKMELEEYLALEPEGENADMAKNLLSHLK